MSRAPRMAIIGARRARQGLGPFVARDLTRAGCEVTAFCTSNHETAEEAGKQLLSLGVKARGFNSAEELLAETLDLDGVAILSPTACHAEHLALALEAGLHVLCEKPLVDPGSAASDLALGFHERGLLLVENCQWPAALTALAKEDERFARGPQESFSMGLAPEGRGLVLLQESLSHPISILQECLGPELDFTELSWDWNLDQSAVNLSCNAHSSERVISVRIELACTDIRPRPAWFEFDNLRAEREVREEDYSIGFRVEERLIPILDPLSAHLSHFAGLLHATVEGCPPPHPEPLIQRAALFCALIEDAHRTTT